MRPGNNYITVIWSDTQTKSKVICADKVKSWVSQDCSKTLQTIGICNDAILNVTSLPAGTPSQVTMQSQLQVMEYLSSLLVVVDGLLTV